MNRFERGFTLVELLVVIAMLMLLAGAVTSSIASAQRRAKIAKATAEAQEITNAIRAYEHFGPEYELPKFSSWTAASEDKMSFILGGDSDPNGGKMPVLFNASIRKSKKGVTGIFDPWGNPYYVMIKEGQSFKDTEDSSSDNNIRSYVAFPNFNRRPAAQQ